MNIIKSDLKYFFWLAVSVGVIFGGIIATAVMRNFF